MAYKKILILHILFLCGLLTCGCDSRYYLFNGKDLAGWTFYPPQSKNIWSLGSGTLLCAGNPDAYIRTSKQYSNYHLHLEYRWRGFPSNSGVLLHSVGADKLWPDCFEVQLRSGDAGDIIIHGPATVTGADGKRLVTNGNSFLLIPKAMDSSENPPGQWNGLDIFCKNNSIQVFVNGFLQNRLNDLSRSAGSICLQSQGSALEFANIYIVPMSQP